MEYFDWEISNFYALDLKNKLVENNYRLVKKALPIYWNKEKELVEQIFKEFEIKIILSRRSNRGEVSIIKDSKELSLLLRPFNFEFLITSSGKVYSTKNNPIYIREPRKT